MYDLSVLTHSLDSPLVWLLGYWPSGCWPISSIWLDSHMPSPILHFPLLYASGWCCGYCWWWLVFRVSLLATILFRFVVVFAPIVVINWHVPPLVIEFGFTSGDCFFMFGHQKQPQQTSLASRVVMPYVWRTHVFSQCPFQKPPWVCFHLHPLWPPLSATLHQISNLGDLHKCHSNIFRQTSQKETTLNYN